jgi:hypothetical protein
MTLFKKCKHKIQNYLTKKKRKKQNDLIYAEVII